jgi:hypothetical protein
VLAYVTVENVGNVDESVSISEFKFIEKSGVTHTNLFAEADLGRVRRWMHHILLHSRSTDNFLKPMDPS